DLSGVDPDVQWTMTATAAFQGGGGLTEANCTTASFQSAEGLTLISSSGQVLWGPLGPHIGGLGPGGVPAPHPAAAIDMDGDGLPEALINTDLVHMIYRIDALGPTLLVSVPVPLAGQVFFATGPGAFDFRGLGPD